VLSFLLIDGHNVYNLDRGFICELEMDQSSGFGRFESRFCVVVAAKFMSGQLSGDAKTL